MEEIKEKKDRSGRKMNMKKSKEKERKEGDRRMGSRENRGGRVEERGKDSK